VEENMQRPWKWYVLGILVVVLVGVLACGGPAETPQDPKEPEESSGKVSEVEPFKPGPGPGKIITVGPKTPPPPSGFIAYLEWSVDDVPLGPGSAGELRYDVNDDVLLFESGTGKEIKRSVLTIHQDTDPGEPGFEAYHTLTIEKVSGKLEWTLVDDDGQSVTLTECDPNSTCKSGSSGIPPEMYGALKTITVEFEDSSHSLPAKEWSVDLQTETPDS